MFYTFVEKCFTNNGIICQSFTIHVLMWSMVVADQEACECCLVFSCFRHFCSLLVALHLNHTQVPPTPYTHTTKGGEIQQFSRFTFSLNSNTTIKTTKKNPPGIKSVIIRTDL